MLDNQPNKSNKFRTKNWVEVNDEACGTYNTNIQTNFKTAMLKPSLCYYSDAYILVKRTVTVAQVLAPTEPDNDGKEVVFKNRVLLIDYLS